MKKRYLILILPIACIFSGSCRDANRKVDTEVNNSADSTEIDNGVPLDNIHPSRPSDTVSKKEADEQGIPLDSLDRDKRSKK